MRVRSCFIPAAIGLIGLAHPCSAAGAWPMFRHDPQRSGRTDVVGPENQPPHIRFQLQPSVTNPQSFTSSPAIGPDGTLYLGDLGGTLFAIPADGDATKVSFFTLSGAIYSSPAVDSSGNVTVGCWNGFDGGAGRVYGFGPDLSHELWQFDTPGPVDSSPVTAGDGTVYVGDDSERLYALTPRPQLADQAWQWRSGQPDDDIKASPVLDSSGTCYFGGQSGNFYAVDAQGNLVPGYPFPANGPIVCTAACDEQRGLLFFGSQGAQDGSANGTVYALAMSNPSVDAWHQDLGTGWAVLASPALEPDGTVIVAAMKGLDGAGGGEVVAFDGATGTPKWNYQVPQGVQSSPLIDGHGNIYFGADNAQIYALNQNGSLLWQQATDGAVESSLALGEDGTLYAATVHGQVYAIQDGAQQSAPVAYGDVNGDGAVTVADVVMVLRFVVGQAVPTPQQFVAADVAPAPSTPGGKVGDGKITVADALRILRHAIGLDNGLPWS